MNGLIKAKCIEQCNGVHGDICFMKGKTYFFVLELSKCNKTRYNGLNVYLSQDVHYNGFDETGRTHSFMGERIFSDYFKIIDNNAQIKDLLKSYPTKINETEDEHYRIELRKMSYTGTDLKTACKYFRKGWDANQRQSKKINVKGR